MMALVKLSEMVAVEEHELEERFVRASGPGGQNVNKVATAVELRFDVAGSSLDPGVKVRLEEAAGTRMTSDGVLVIDSREHRTQAQNRIAARRRLASFLEEAARLPKTRRPTRPSRASREQRLDDKRRRAQVKTGRGRPARDD